MRLGVIGLPGAGKSTVFEALTRNISDSGNKSETRIGAITVPDARVDRLSAMYNPKKTIYPQVEYLLPGVGGQDKDKGQSPWTPVRDCDALIHVVRNFGGYGYEPPKPLEDFRAVDQDLILADLVIAEKRMERLDLDHKRGKKMDPEEHALLTACLESLNQEIPLRRRPELATAPALKGFAFVSARPVLVLFNNEDDDDALPDVPELTGRENCMIIRGKLEQELAQMSEEEAADFLAEFNISQSATDRVIRKSYELLGLISFFTVGPDEVRAWTIRADTHAADAAGAIHTDMKKGFIRAEVIAYDDLMDAGSYPEARKKGTVRLEGKTYPVCDGDIIEFRFNV